MKTKKIFFGLVILQVSILFRGYAQTTLTPSIENISPPSPNVSAINKFGNTPVGQSTGIPNIGVPIYNWTGKNFGKSVSISLNYHNGGVKVDETASNIGLGWALNAGGVISRSVRGIYDELPGDGFLERAMPANSSEGNSSPGVPNNERTFFKMNANLVDTQNDVFSYNFNGNSGSFVLGKNNDILFLEQTKIRVEKFVANINGKQLLSKFIIIDEYGFKFVFEDYETTVKVGGNGLHAIFTSAWYLSRIINPTNNDSVEFQYETTSFRNQFRGSSTIALPLSGDGFGQPADMSGGAAHDIIGKRIKKITFPDANTVDFYYNPLQRQDLTGDYMLQKIKMSKGTSSFGFLLNQDYSISGRATLKGVTPIGGAEEQPDKPYTFEYNTVLADKFSVQQDHWGYYNYNNGSFIPHEYFKAPGGAYNPWREFGGGNRDTDPVRVKGGSMVKMTYPTGGYTLYEMEANTAKDNWLEQNETVTVTNPPYTDKSLNEGLNGDNYPAANIPFLFNGENNTSTAFEITLNPLGGNCSSGCAVKFEFYNASNAFVSSQQINFTDPSPDPYSITKSFSLYGLTKGQMYSIKVSTINVTSYHEYVQIKWREINNGSTSNVVLKHIQPYVGGLRAKKITDYSYESTVPAQVREYEYVLEDGVTSSGALGFRPVYTYLVYYDYKNNPIHHEEPSYHGNFNYNYAIRTTSTVNEMAYAVGSPVTYKRVVEKVTSNGSSLGKTVRYFTNFADSPPFVQDIFPSVPTQYTPWSLGLLKKEEIYNAANQKLKQTENAYSSVSDEYASVPARVENFRSISIAPVKFLWDGNPFTPHIVPTAEPHYFLASNFTPVSGRTELIQTVTTEYSPGKPDLVLVTNNTYDPQDYYLKESKMIDSKNQERKTVTMYPKDLSVSGSDAPVFAAMYAKNMLKNVIGEKQYLNNIELMSQRQGYSNWSTGLYAPSGIYTQKQGYNENLRIRFTDYNSHGAVVSVMQENGIPMCYVWGYGGDYLITKVTNASYTSVLAILGGIASVESIRNDKSPSDSTIENITNLLRNGLPQAQVEGYTYNTLFGITSQSDAKGLKKFYSYDLFGRLQHVKDLNGNIVKTHTYNYKN